MVVICKMWNVVMTHDESGIIRGLYVSFKFESHLLSLIIYFDDLYCCFEVENKMIDTPFL